MIPPLQHQEQPHHGHGYRGRLQEEHHQGHQVHHHHHHPRNQNAYEQNQQQLCDRSPEAAAFGEQDSDTNPEMLARVTSGRRSRRPPAPVAPHDPELLLRMSSPPPFPWCEDEDAAAASILGASRVSTSVYCPRRRKTATVPHVLVPHQQEDAPGVPRQAYWIQRTLRNAIYGRVRYGVILRERVPAGRQQGQYQGDQPQPMEEDQAQWEITEEPCAIKEMSWEKIMELRGRHAENPMNEVGALQYLMDFHRIRNPRRHGRTEPAASSATYSNGQQVDHEAEVEAETDGSKHVLVPMDICSDGTNLYIVSPYCNGGELFDLLDESDQFSEREARYWMRQILLGLEHLQEVGICHRDLSLENLLVHDNKTLVIDLGMCLRVPFENPEAADIGRRGAPPVGDIQARRGRRLLMPPQGTCGKWHYMSPEILSNTDPFDGYAVDLWAAGVILFLMVTGFPPWERACDTDERFRYLTRGYMVQLLTQWDLGLSPDLMDLLQRMLHQDPTLRLTLQGVFDHPWMNYSQRRTARQGRSRATAA